MKPSTLHNLARAGAVARVAELQAELAEIQSEFPDLVGHKGRVIRRSAAPQPARKKRTMSAKARAAISKAQKARWAKLRTKKVAK